MNKVGSAAKVKLNSFDDLFGASDMTAGTDQVQEIPLSELYEFNQVEGNAGFQYFFYPAIPMRCRYGFVER